MSATFRAAYALLTAVVLVGAAVCEDARASEPLIIGTASPGGPYLTYGQGVARILSRELGQEVTHNQLKARYKTSCCSKRSR
jgi:uncharacterized protein